MEKIPQLLDLTGKTSIITGGSRGIGLGIALRLAEAGSSVVIAGLHTKEMEEAILHISERGGKAFFFKADISKENDVKKLMAYTLKKTKSIDILVNNAGIFPSITIAEMTTKEFEKVISVNLKGVFLCTKYGSKEMIKQGRGGKIINITSIDALHPSSIGLAHYDASKHGVWGFTKNSALELATHKIWVNAIAPGGIATPGVQAMQTAPAGSLVDMKKMLKSFLGKIPMHRMGDPDDIGKVALFLASDMSSYMTGSQIVVDGGVLLS